MTDFQKQMQPIIAAERPLMQALVAEYLTSTVDLDRSERLKQERRKQFFTPHFQHLTGITRAWIIIQCAMDVTRQVHEQLLAAMSDDDKISCDDGWRNIVDRFLATASQQPGFLFKSASEKWGALDLRYQCDPTGQDACREAEKLATETSLQMCEKCGQPGRLRSGGWRKTLCNQHAAGRYDD